MLFAYGINRFSRDAAQMIPLIFKAYLSPSTAKPTKWNVCPAKTQISLGSLISLHWAFYRKPITQPFLIWTAKIMISLPVFAGCTCHSAGFVVPWHIILIANKLFLAVGYYYSASRSKCEVFKWKWSTCIIQQIGVFLSLYENITIYNMKFWMVCPRFTAYSIYCVRLMIWARPCKNVSCATCKQQRCWSDCASAQSDQHLCCSLLR